MSESRERDKLRRQQYHTRKLQQAKKAIARQVKGNRTDPTDWKIEIQYHESMIQSLRGK